MIPMPGEERKLIQNETEKRRFLEALVKRAVSFLADETDLEVKSVSYIHDDLDKLELLKVTSILTIEDRFKMIVAFTYEEELLNAVFRKYADGLEVRPEEYNALLEETAGDMINIVVGNILGEFQTPGCAYALSTPIVINEAKSIFRYKSSVFFTAYLETAKGRMNILCITPGVHYDRKLNLGDGL